jgi:hypothetical protein
MTSSNSDCPSLSISHFQISLKFLASSLKLMVRYGTADALYCADIYGSGGLMKFNGISFKRLYHSVTHVRTVCYSAFGSPGYGITWSLLTFGAGLVYLIYDQRKRRNLQPDRENATVELQNSSEPTKEGE